MNDRHNVRVDLVVGPVAPDHDPPRFRCRSPVDQAVHQRCVWLEQQLDTWRALAVFGWVCVLVLLIPLTLEFTR